MRIINNYEVYKRSHSLTLEIYKISRQFPREELYGLTSQIRRSASSIPMNLKEGGPGSESLFHKYVRIALGSKEELDYQLLLAKDLNYITEEDWQDLNDEVAETGRMLYGLLKNKSGNEVRSK